MMRDEYVTGEAPDFLVPDNERQVDVDSRAYQRGLAKGFWTAGGLYALLSVVLVMAFHALSVHP